MFADCASVRIVRIVRIVWIVWIVQVGGLFGLLCKWVDCSRIRIVQIITTCFRFRTTLFFSHNFFSVHTVPLFYFYLHRLMGECAYSECLPWEVHSNSNSNSHQFESDSYAFGKRDWRQKSRVGAVQIIQKESITATWLKKIGGKKKKRAVGTTIMFRRKAPCL